VPLLLTLPAFMLLHRLAPHARLHWADIWPAAAISALFFTLGQTLLTFYLTHLGHFNALAGSLGAAILFLAFVYYGAQVGLLAAEFAKHRLLVRAGAVPATDPVVRAAPRSRAQQVTGLLARLWTVQESHHDNGLPYRPSRLEPGWERADQHTGRGALQAAPGAGARGAGCGAVDRRAARARRCRGTCYPMRSPSCKRRWQVGHDPG